MLGCETCGAARSRTRMSGRRLRRLVGAPRTALRSAERKALRRKRPFPTVVAVSRVSSTRSRFHLGKTHDHRSRGDAHYNNMNRTERPLRRVRCVSPEEEDTFSSYHHSHRHRHIHTLTTLWENARPRLISCAPVPRNLGVSASINDHTSIIALRARAAARGVLKVMVL